MPLSPELTQYITQAREAGLSDDAIRAELLKAGWQVADVNKAIPARMPSFAPVVAPAEPVAAKPRRSHIGFIVTTILILAIGGAVYFFLPDIVGVYMKYFEKPIVRGDDVVIPTVPIPSDTSASSTAGWLLYRNETYGFEFKYPALLLLKTTEQGVQLSHDVDYKHPSPCDFKGDAPPVDTLTDFNVLFQLVDKGAQDYIKTGTWPDWNYVSQNPFKTILGDGFKVSSGIEGCGKDLYYVIISPTKTLVIDRSYVAEFNPVNGEYQKFLALPGVISPEDSENTFNKILSTFKFISPTASTSVTVLSPNGGEIWKRGSKQKITWVFTGDTLSTDLSEPVINVVLESSETPYKVVSVPLQSSSYEWTVGELAGDPNLLPQDGLYRVTICRGNGRCDSSDAPITIAK